MKKFGSVILKGALSLFMVFAVLGVSKERINAEDNSSSKHETQYNEDRYDYPYGHNDVEQESVSLNVGEEYRIKDYLYQDVDYSSDEDKVATVDSYGNITANSVGKATITVSKEVWVGFGLIGQFESKPIKYFNVNVEDNTPVEGIFINNEENLKTIYVGEEKTVNAVITPAGAINKGITYSSSKPNIATIDSFGTLEGITEGTTIITVTSQGENEYGKHERDSITVTVKPKITPVTGIYLDKKDKDITMYVKDTHRVNPIVEPDDATNKKVSYTSDNKDVATVDENGKITATGKGTATITVTSQGENEKGKKETASIAVTVKPKIIPVTGICLDKKDKDITMYVKDTHQVNPIVEPEKATNKKVSYTSDKEDVATVDENGKITATGKGTATITVTSQGENEKGEQETASIAVTVKQKYIPVSYIELDKPFINMHIKGTDNMKAKVKPLDATNQNIIYTSFNTNAATVDENGNITATGVGMAIITATSERNNKFGTPEIAVLTVIVTPKYTSVSNVDIQEKSFSMMVKDTKQISTKIYPKNATNKGVIYSSSDEKTLTVNNRGEITAKAGGTATVTATSKDNYGSCTPKSDSIEVTVIQPVTGVEVQEKPISLMVGNTHQITTNVSPSDATNKDLSYKSSNEKILTVDKNGLITAKGKGIAVVSVESKDSSRQRSSISDQVVVAVIQPVKGIKLDETETTIEVGDSYQIPASIEPTDATYQRLTYKSGDKTIAEVDKNGKITAKGVGNTYIKITSSGTAKDGKKVSEAFKITVKEKYKPVTDIDLDEAIVPLSLEESYTIDAQVIPGSATEQGLIYKSSDENVLTVNEAGIVDVNSTGAAFVTVTSEGNNEEGKQEVDSLLFVINEPVTGIEMDQDSTVLNPEDKYQIKAKITPDNATRQGVTYTSDNEAVATVNETGEVIAVEPGFATITITSNGHDENGKVVEKNFGLIVADIEINTDDMNLTTGETFQLDAKFTPEDVMNSNVVYGSSDSNVVSVNESGEVKALKEGTATITVSSEAYTNITESFEVSVKDKKDEVNTDPDKDNPTKPTKPQGDKNQTKDNQQVVEKAKDPVTGDSTNVTAVVIIMIISGAAILYLNRRKRLH
ncbi:Ig-like domain-containing protein [Breznakia pachnodae]|uniref:Uncharacterized protein YjdB n=1 Tax=Breznakia pachnodae TaxID=265178 RepID=A0ABU0DZ63_9FIRM|nr:Ig-like domain-containing protein [Breznakia pachnodae]MDQ0359926.1 uncharacterized protein YjdB [Breznakia pachnodae]